MVENGVPRILWYIDYETGQASFAEPSLAKQHDSEHLDAYNDSIRGRTFTTQDQKDAQIIVGRNAMYAADETRG